MQSPFEIIKQYVENKLSAKEFEKYLHSDDSLQTLLSEEISIHPYTIKDTLFTYLLSIDLTHLPLKH